MAKTAEAPATSGGPTWRETQELLRNCTTKEQVMELINAERAGVARTLWINRMLGRYRVLRNAEEDAKLQKTYKEG